MTADRWNDYAITQDRMAEAETAVLRCQDPLFRIVDFFDDETVPERALARIESHAASLLKLIQDIRVQARQRRMGGTNERAA